jgi:hypothetical protein
MSDAIVQRHARLLAKAGSVEKTVKARKKPPGRGLFL